MGNMSEDFFESGRRLGATEGERKGRNENQRSTASRMLTAGKLTLEEIADYVGLPCPKSAPWRNNCAARSATLRP